MRSDQTGFPRASRHAWARSELGSVLPSGVAPTAALAGTTVCYGSRTLTANWDAAILTIDGKTYQMKKDKNGKKSFTLRGNDITFSHTEESGRYHSVLHINGGSESYRCQKIDNADAEPADVVPYNANFVVDTQHVDPSAEVHGARGTSNGGEGGHKGGGGVVRAEARASNRSRSRSNTRT